MQPTIKPDSTDKAVSPHERRRQARARQRALPAEVGMLKIFWCIVVVLLGYCLITSPGRPWVFTFSALLVSAFALLPAYLWCHRMVFGLPIFPFFAGAFVLTHALQFIFAEPAFRAYPAGSIQRAGLTVAVFLLVATLVWWFWVKLPRPLPATCRVLEARRGTDFLLVILVGSTVVTVLSHAGWLAHLPGGVITVVQNFFRGPTAFAVFVLAMRWGGRALRPEKISIFIGLFIAYCMADASSLFLVMVVITCLMLVLGFIIGRQSVPLIWIVPMLAMVGFLHIGKGEMRSRYWSGGERSNLQPWSYPAFYAEWFICSMEQLISQKQGGDEAQSVFSRVSTVNILLEAQELSPKEVPFLGGATYAIIPSALVPRIFYSGKASPHESTTMLNVHFGKQTQEDAQSTSIGWGLLNEAYANFGYAGCLALAVILGTFYGLVTRASIGLPPTSMSTLVGIFTLSFTLQTEMTAAIYITAYLQGLFALLVMAYPFTELRPLGSGNGRKRKSEGGGRRSDDGGRKQEAEPPASDFGAARSKKKQNKSRNWESKSQRSEAGDRRSEKQKAESRKQN